MSKPTKTNLERFDAMTEEKRVFIQHIIRDEDLRRDLMDLSIMEERRNEPARPLRDYLKEKGERA
ncbi:MAG: hypothetical protein WA821_01830 [Anaerolineales bacterium]